MKKILYSMLAVSVMACTSNKTENTVQENDSTDVVASVLKDCIMDA